MRKVKVTPYSKITSYIYIGTNACCFDNFQKELLKLGIRADILLEEERLCPLFGSNFFLWLPTADFTAPSQKQLELGSLAIDFFVKNKIKVFVHCKRGQGRSPTLVAASFITKGLTVNEAIKKIKKNRPEVIIGRQQRQALVKFASWDQTPLRLKKRRNVASQLSGFIASKMS